jgi:peptide-methionine (S)-S-oxide reductase
VLPRTLMNESAQRAQPHGQNLSRNLLSTIENVAQALCSRRRLGFAPACRVRLGTATKGQRENRHLFTGTYQPKEMSVMKTKLAFLLLTSLVAYTSIAQADKTVLAGGCFWCMESDFEKLAGVTDVVSGFTGGELKDPTYSGNHTGHYEAVEITYDPAKVSYKQLIDHFWVNVDPFDARGQFCDKGHSYLSAIFVANETEKKIAHESRMKVVAQFPKEKVITPILAASTFYPIKGNESNHQDYYKNNPVRYKAYRWGCGRDRRLTEIWGDKATH